MADMVDLHTHTFLSDGQLGPAELIRRAEVAGYGSLALTDHVDLSTMEGIIPQLVAAAELENRLGKMLVVPGAELTHVRPEQIGEATARARELGALLVLCHGETLVEPVLPGTNRAALDAGVDVLAHPGLITAEEAALAAGGNVALEITAKAGHSYTNGHVAATAAAAGARLVYGTDGHVPEHLTPRPTALRILRGAGLSAAAAEGVLTEGERLLRAKDTAKDASQDAM
jgi:histidinol phosphatase-like PHP family hydrolase